MKATRAQMDAGEYSSQFDPMVQGVVCQAAEDGRILSANPAAERLLGLTVDQMQGRTLLDPLWRLIHEDGSEFSGEMHPCMVALRTGRSVENVVMGLFNPRKDRHCWMKVSATPQFKMGGSSPDQILAIFDEISERKPAVHSDVHVDAEFEESLAFSPVDEHSLLQIEKVIGGISGRLIDADSNELNAAIDDALHDLGELMRVDGGCVVVVGKEDESLANVREWCAEGIAPRPAELRERLVREFAWTPAARRQQQLLYVPRVEDLSDGPDFLRKTLEVCGIQSVLCIPMFWGDTFRGVVEFDAVNAPKTWPEEHVVALQNLGNVLARAFEQAENRRSQELASGEWQAIFNGIGDAIWVFDADNRILRCNVAAEKLFNRSNDEIVGLKCHELFDGVSEPPKEGPFYVLGKRAVTGGEIQSGGRWYDLEVFPIPRGLVSDAVGLHVIRDVTATKLADQTRDEASGKAQAYLNVAGVMFVGLDAKGCVSTVNQWGCKILGYDREEAVGKDWFSTFLPESVRDDVRQVYDLLMRDEVEIVEYFENPVLARDGSERVIAWHNAVIRDADGRPVGTISSGQDVTELRRSGEALRHSEERNRLLLDSMTETVMLLDAETMDVVGVNPAGEKLYGYTHEEFLSLNHSEITAEPEASKQSMDETVAGEANDIPLRLHRKKDGTVFPVEISTNRIVTGERVLLCGVIRDIAKRRQIEDIAKSQHDLVLALRGARDLGKTMEICLDAALSVSRMDTGAISLLNEQSGDFELMSHRGISESFLEEVSQFKADAGSPGAQLALRGDAVFTTGVDGFGLPVDDILRKEGLRALAIVPIQYADTVVGCLNLGSHTLSTIPEYLRLVLETLGHHIGREVMRVRAEESKERAEHELARQQILSIRSDRLHALGEMAAGIAHELNQPLVGVRGMAEHMLVAGKRGWQMDEERVHRKLQSIVEQADRMTHVISHVREFSRRSKSVDVQFVDINEIVVSALSLLQAQLESRGIEVKLCLSASKLVVQVNPFSLEEVVQNCLTNARDAIEELRSDEGIGGSTSRITLRTHPVSRDRQRYVVLEIEDTGVGVPPELLEAVFDPFFTTKGPSKGTGLGLSISRSIIDACGGEMHLKSTPGVGTTVTLTFEERTASHEKAEHTDSRR